MKDKSEVIFYCELVDGRRFSYDKCTETEEGFLFFEECFMLKGYDFEKIDSITLKEEKIFMTYTAKEYA